VDLAADIPVLVESRDIAGHVYTATRGPEQRRVCRW
jgi:hypothetical protein